MYILNLIKMTKFDFINPIVYIKKNWVLSLTTHIFSQLAKETTRIYIQVSLGIKPNSEPFHSPFSMLSNAV